MGLYFDDKVLAIRILRGEEQVTELASTEGPDGYRPEPELMAIIMDCLRSDDSTLKYYMKVNCTCTLESPPTTHIQWMLCGKPQVRKFLGLEEPPSASPASAVAVGVASDVE